VFPQAGRLKKLSVYETVYCDDLTSSHYTSSWMTEYIIYGENNEKDENILELEDGIATMVAMPCSLALCRKLNLAGELGGGNRLAGCTISSRHIVWSG